jgi:hypothetical protein
MALAGTELEQDPSVVRDPGSYRDPSGFVYQRDGRLLRQVNRSFATHWDRLRSSGFLTDLVERGWLVPFEDAPLDLAAEPASAHAVIAPLPIEFVSYPFEWTFSELQDAALRTLELEAAARRAGFTLKDASADNIQFWRGSPVLIDTLSFEVVEPGAPWIAYRQFCEHFLAPLALMAYRDIRLGLLLRPYVNGLPLDLASKLLPRRTYLRFGLVSHIHVHARVRRSFRAETWSNGGHAPKGKPTARNQRKLSDLGHRALIDSLRSAVRKLTWDPHGSEWARYADETSYSSESAAAKDRIVRKMIGASSGRVVWDMGANTGRYSRIAADLGKHVIAFDIDPGAAEILYREVRGERLTSILPLLVDVLNPSPGLGWAGMERKSLVARASAEVVLALALVHHLAITGNVPLPAVAAWLAQLAPEAIVEFVPKEDPMVEFLLASRDDIFPDYTIEHFRSAVAPLFETIAEHSVDGSTRVLFHLRRR